MDFVVRRRASVFRRRPVALFVALALPAIAAQAQAESATQLSEVVVSASGFEQDIKQAPASISVVTREELQTKQFRDLAEALQDVPGIDVRGGTGKTGGLDISIRGMPSDYTLILIDGRRQNVAGDVTPNGFSAALTSLIPPVSAIERIEIVRGPMSTLYGSDAMGGVINIITRKVAKKWGGEVTLETGIPQDSAWGTQNRANFYVSGPLKQDLLGLALRGGIYRRDAADWVLAPGATQPAAGRNPAPAQTRQNNVGARLTLTPNRQNDIWLDVEQGRTWYNNDDGRLGNRDAAAPLPWGRNSPPGYKDYLRFNRDQLALGHTGRLGGGLLESSLTRTVTKTLGRTIPGAAVPIGDPRRGADRELETTNVVLDSKLVAPLGDAHTLTVGGQWWDAKLVDGLLPENHSQTMWALFVEDEWRFTDSLAATFGGRYDRHDAFGSQFSPRGYLVWTATPQWTLKGGVSRGFKAPSLNQLIDGVSGVGSQGAVLSIGNPNLKPETSTSTELSALFDNKAGLTASATLFYNDIDDKIAAGGGSCTSAWISSCAVNPTADYAINVDKAKTRGLELSGRLQLARQWGLRLGYTWTDSEVTEGGVKSGQLANTAKHIANAQLDWTPGEKWRFWLRGEYRGKSPRFMGNLAALNANEQAINNAVGSELKAYQLFHLGGAYDVSKNVTVNANIFNLFDKDFRGNYQQVNTDGGPIWVNDYFYTSRSVAGSTPAGRTLWISANVKF